MRLRNRHRGGVLETVTVMHYPRRISLIKRKRKSGFRARMRTHSGRKLINRKRRVGRRVSVA
jgi:large subunit ribosomal protein L34